MDELEEIDEVLKKVYQNLKAYKEDLIIYSPNETIPLQKYLDFSYATVIDELDDDGEEIEIEDLI